VVRPIGPSGCVAYNLSGTEVDCRPFIIVELGVNLMRSMWGLRLGKEALRAVLAHGFDSP
jgi:RimJ/RimL family protein N-acetyltransferase